MSKKKYSEIQDKNIKTVNETLKHEDFENMMRHSSYKRSSGGARRQVM